jgi:hypothetical protein
MAGSRRSLSRCAAVSWQRFIRPVTNGHFVVTVLRTSGLKMKVNVKLVLSVDLCTA